MALPLHDVGPVHARRVHANQDAAWSGYRGFGLPGFQHLGSAETVEQYCLHLSSLSARACARLLSSRSDLHTIPPAQRGSLRNSR